MTIIVGVAAGALLALIVGAIRDRCHRLNQDIDQIHREVTK